MAAAAAPPPPLRSFATELTLRADGLDRVFLASDTRREVLHHFASDSASCADRELSEAALDFVAAQAARAPPKIPAAAARTADCWWHQSLTPDDTTRAWWKVVDAESVFAYAVTAPPAAGGALVLSWDHAASRDVAAAWFAAAAAPFPHSVVSTQRVFCGGESSESGACALVAVAVTNEFARLAFESPAALDDDADDDAGVARAVAAASDALVHVTGSGKVHCATRIAISADDDDNVGGAAAEEDGRRTAVAAAVAAFGALTKVLAPNEALVARVPVAETEGVGGPGAAAFVVAHAATAAGWVFDETTSTLRIASDAERDAIRAATGGRTKCELRYNAVAACVALHIAASARKRVAAIRAASALRERPPPFAAVVAAIRHQKDTLSGGTVRLVADKAAAGAVAADTLVRAMLHDAPSFEDVSVCGGGGGLTSAPAPVETLIALHTATVSVRPTAEFVGAWHAVLAVARLEDRGGVHRSDGAADVDAEATVSEVAEAALTNVVARAIRAAASASATDVAESVHEHTTVAEWFRAVNAVSRVVGSFLARVLSVVAAAPGGAPVSRIAAVRAAPNPAAPPTSRR
jgi:hypothetical protein